MADNLKKTANKAQTKPHETDGLTSLKYVRQRTNQQNTTARNNTNSATAKSVSNKGKHSRSNCVFL